MLSGRFGSRFTRGVLKKVASIAVLGVITGMVLTGCSSSNVPPGKIDQIKEDAMSLFLSDYKLAKVEYIAQTKDRFNSDYFYQLVSGVAGETLTDDEDLERYYNLQDWRYEDVKSKAEQGVQLPGVYADEEGQISEVYFDAKQNKAIVRIDFEWFDIGYTSTTRQSVIELGYDENDKINFFRETVFSFYPERILS